MAVCFPGKCGVPVDHHQATAIKVLVTAGPLLRQTDTDLQEERRSEGAKDQGCPCNQ